MPKFLHRVIQGDDAKGKRIEAARRPGIALSCLHRPLKNQFEVRPNRPLETAPIEP
jgi:hypothetical protein